MPSWINENCVSIFQSFGIKILKTGRIPNHVAFIMDGNRRYAKKYNAPTTTGHVKGFETLSNSVKWCIDLGISEVTVYAFSIENFKRGEEEVNDLMNLARDKIWHILEDIDDMNELGIKFHVAGRLSLLPDDLRVLVSKAMLATKHNKKLQLNLAFAYTGRDEISRAASHIVSGVQSNMLPVDDIDEDLVSETLDLSRPDLLVRSSGEVRLSDFMLWQVSDTVLYFTDTLWPDISIWNMLAAIIHFQRHAPPPTPVKKFRARQQKFLETMEKQRWLEIEKTAGHL